MKIFISNRFNQQKTKQTGGKARKTIIYNQIRNLSLLYVARFLQCCVHWIVLRSIPSCTISQSGLKSRRRCVSFTHSSTVCSIRKTVMNTGNEMVYLCVCCETSNSKTNRGVSKIFFSSNGSQHIGWLKRSRGTGTS